jgi:hypothetical protein
MGKVMRYFGLASVMTLAVLAPLPAAAQQAGTPMGDIQDLNRFATRGFMNQWSATRPAALSGLSQASRRWIKAEVQRQAETPRPVSAVAADIDTVLARDIRMMARSDRVKPRDVSGAILLKVLVDTHNALIREAKRAPDASGERSWEDRITESDLNVREAMAMHSEVAVALVRD